MEKEKEKKKHILKEKLFVIVGEEGVGSKDL
jgi:hypothetical protein